MRIEIEYTPEMQKLYPTWQSFLAFGIAEYYFDTPKCEENRQRYLEEQKAKT